MGAKGAAVCAPQTGVIVVGLALQVDDVINLCLSGVSCLVFVGVVVGGGRAVTR